MGGNTSKAETAVEIDEAPSTPPPRLSETQAPSAAPSAIHSAAPSKSPSAAKLTGGSRGGSARSFLTTATSSAAATAAAAVLSRERLRARMLRLLLPVCATFVLLWVASLVLTVAAAPDDAAAYRTAAIVGSAGLFCAAVTFGAITRSAVSAIERFGGSSDSKGEAAHKAQVAALEASLHETQLAYDSLAALFQRRVYSLGDLGEEASARLSMEIRESLLEAPASVVIPSTHAGRPREVFQHAFADVAKHIAEQKAKSQLPAEGTQWEAATRAARHIRDRGYSLKSFYTDVRLAFPELALYLAHKDEAAVSEAEERRISGVSSGVSAAEEYRRTIGALFCVYWLARLDMDGKRGFCFGVDDDWVPLELPTKSKETDPKLLKRLDFYENQEWGGLTQLCLDAGMLRREPKSGELAVEPERMLAMLALTAIHDVMKVEALLPVVDKAHAPYNGFAAGDTINDHDAALGYVLDHFADCLPSYKGLPEAQQRTVRFTQAKMAFNHGWLVQAEAPPEALFTKFKAVAESGSAEPRDIAFYFVHWLTDLAAAVPTPLEGAEKFVLQFPRAVLGAFIRSFGVLNELAVRTETEVFEQYLVDWWSERVPRLGPLPEGPEAIALMRLVVQAQAEDKQQAAVIAAFGALRPDDRQILCEEMARSGVPGQAYKRTAPLQVSGGPALLVYYSPAFLRTLAPDDALAALSLLAETYRRARQLWPPQSEARGSVTVRIDQIREQKLVDIQSVYGFGDTWVLSRRNDQEAVLERIPVDVVAEQPKDKTKVLKFYKRAVTNKDKIRSVGQLASGGTSEASGSFTSGSRRGPSSATGSTPSLCSQASSMSDTFKKADDNLSHASSDSTNSALHA